MVSAVVNLECAPRSVVFCLRAPVRACACARVRQPRLGRDDHAGMHLRCVVGGRAGLHNLQRLFLSHNSLEAVGALQPLAAVRQAFPTFAIYFD
eukprot:COSAG01_NODE_978_length_12357_cov_10.838554_3_plen_94_part_00